MSTTTWAKLLLCLAPAVLSAADEEHNCTIRDAAAPSSSITYVLCEQGLLLVTGDEGATWATRKIGEAGELSALAFMDVNRGLAVGDGGAILATEDAGKTWTKRQPGTTENLAGIQMHADLDQCLRSAELLGYAAHREKTAAFHRYRATRRHGRADLCHGLLLGFHGQFLLPHTPSFVDHAARPFGSHAAVPRFPSRPQCGMSAQQIVACITACTFGRIDGRQSRKVVKLILRLSLRSLGFVLIPHHKTGNG